MSDPTLPLSETALRSLMKDSERLDWMDRVKPKVSYKAERSVIGMAWEVKVPRVIGAGETFRDALDMAMRLRP